MSLTESYRRDGYRVLYFSPIASHTEFGVSTKVLRNSSKVDNSYSDFKVVGERGPLSHTTARVMDQNNVQYFNLIDRDAVGCWNSLFPYKDEYQTVVDQDPIALSFPADVKVELFEHRLWVISDRMPNFLLSKLDYNDINFRIFSAPIDKLIDGTICKLPRYLTKVDI